MLTPSHQFWLRDAHQKECFLECFFNRVNSQDPDILYLSVFFGQNGVLMVIGVELLREIEGRESTLRLAKMEGPGFVFRGYREWGKPYVDVNFAFRASYLISKSVLASKSCPKLQEELKSAQREYRKKLKETEISVAMSIVESVRKKRELENRKRKNGFVQKIKSMVL